MALIITMPVPLPDPTGNGFPSSSVGQHGCEMVPAGPHSPDALAGAETKSETALIPIISAAVILNRFMLTSSRELMDAAFCLMNGYRSREELIHDHAELYLRL